jgi:hypothetical protein
MDLLSFQLGGGPEICIVAHFEPLGRTSIKNRLRYSLRYVPFMHLLSHACILWQASIHHTLRRDLGDHLPGL